LRFAHHQVRFSHHDHHSLTKGPDCPA
jgi:hypothetical protein